MRSDHKATEGPLLGAWATYDGVARERRVFMQVVLSDAGSVMRHGAAPRTRPHFLVNEPTRHNDVLLCSSAGGM